MDRIIANDHFSEKVFRDFARFLSWRAFVISIHRMRHLLLLMSSMRSITCTVLVLPTEISRYSMLSLGVDPLVKLISVSNENFRKQWKLKPSMWSNGLICTRNSARKFALRIERSGFSWLQHHQSCGLWACQVCNWKFNDEDDMRNGAMCCELIFCACLLVMVSLCPELFSVPAWLRCSRGVGSVPAVHKRIRTWGELLASSRVDNEIFPFDS